MKKKFFSIIMILVLIFTMVSVKKDIQAANKKIYSFSAADCTKFVKSNGRLKVKVVKEWAQGMCLNSYTVDKQNLNIPLAKNCKWSKDYAGEIGYSRFSYKEIKSHIKAIRAAFVKWGECSSPGGVQITVEKGKITRVNLRLS